MLSIGVLDGNDGHWKWVRSIEYSTPIIRSYPPIDSHISWVYGQKFMKIGCPTKSIMLHCMVMFSVPLNLNLVLLFI